jgi:hypothetical protein
MDTSVAQTPDLDTTVPFPKIEDESHTERLKKSPGHRRSISGNLLTKLFRGNSDADKDRAEGEKLHLSRTQANAEDKRRRKGSLRKTVLGKSRDRKGSDKRSPLSSERSSPLQSPDANATPRPSEDVRSHVSPDSPPRWPFRTLSKVSLPSIRSSVPSFDPASSAASITSPTLPADSTDEEELSITRLVARKPPSSSGGSYFPEIEPRRIHTKSPLATSPQSSVGSPVELEDWDYSETAFWGYVILIVTWIVFVVGMGSCFGVWSWAWDVGETPYAPPELEDDATLPIVGYYPALLVLTCIMAWVWVVVAWVGMKYFRHADLRGDD